MRNLFLLFLFAGTLAQAQLSVELTPGYTSFRIDDPRNVAARDNGFALQAAVAYDVFKESKLMLAPEIRGIWSFKDDLEPSPGLSFGHDNVFLKANWLTASDRFLWGAAGDFTIGESAFSIRPMVQINFEDNTGRRSSTSYNDTFLSIGVGYKF